MSITDTIMCLHTHIYFRSSKLLTFCALVCFRVVNQYQELVQNEAKCPVKMFHNSSGSVNLSHLSPGKEMEVSLSHTFFLFALDC